MWLTFYEIILVTLWRHNCVIFGLVHYQNVSNFKLPRLCFVCAMFIFAGLMQMTQINYTAWP